MGNSNSSAGSFSLSGGDDFSNNLFTDLGPLLTLFGAEATTQFMSQSLGLADNILLAIGPLGVITILVAAIRVGGPPSLKSFIGRARESLSAVEVQLLSSTSSEVCEMMNGKRIARIPGRSTVAEVLIRYHNHSPSEIYLKEQEVVTQVRGHGQATSYVKGYSRREGQIPEDAEKRLSTPSSAETVESLPHSILSPNISLNLLPNRRLELYSWSIVAIFLQVGVLIIDFLITYHWRLRKDDDKGVASTAFPFLLIGTLMLIIGLAACGFVIQCSTHETWYDIKPDMQVETIWLQRKAVVNEQNFRSYITFAPATRKALVSSIRAEHLQSDRERHPSSANIKKPYFTRTITVAGVVIALVGYILQFIGFRQMNWFAAILQLALSLAMTAIRAWVRRGLAPEETWEIPEGHELDWLATRATMYGCGQSARRSRVQIWPRLMQDSQQSYSWLIENKVTNTQNSPMLSGTQDGVALNRIGGRKPRVNTNRAFHILSLRQSIQQRIRWPSDPSVIEAAESLARAIETVMETIISDPLTSFQMKENWLGRESYDWSLPVYLGGPSSLQEEIFFRIQPIDIGEEWKKNTRQGRSWFIDRSSLEAAISLWTYRLDHPNEETTRKLRRAFYRVAIGAPSMIRDCTWWVFRRNSSLGQRANPSSHLRVGREFLRNGVSTRTFGIDFHGSGQLEWAFRLGPIQQSLPQSCAWHLFAAFMHEISEHVASIGGITTPDLPNWVFEQPKIGSIQVNLKLSNDALVDLCQKVAETGICDVDQAAMAVVPPMAFREILPEPTSVVDYVIYSAKFLETQEQWIEAAKLYGDLIETFRSFSSKSLVYLRALAAATEFMRLLPPTRLIYSIRQNDCRKAETESSKALLETVIQQCPEDMLQKVYQLYRVQLMPGEFESLNVPQVLTIDDSNMYSATQSYPHNYLHAAATGVIKLRYSVLRDEDEKDKWIRAIIAERDHCGWTALHFSVRMSTKFERPGRRRHSSSINVTRYRADCELLIRYHADVNAVNIFGETPLHCAVRAGEDRLISILIHYNADPDAKDRLGRTAAHLAAKRAHDGAELLRILYAKGASIDIRDRWGQTPLHTAAMTRNFEAVRALVEEMNASVTAKEGMGFTAAHFVFSTPDAPSETTDSIKTILELLKKHGFNLHDKTEDRATLLNCAARCGSVKMMRVLLPSSEARGTSQLKRTVLVELQSDKKPEEVSEPLDGDIRRHLTLEDRGGMMPHHWAAKNGHSEALRFLLGKGDEYFCYKEMVESQASEGQSVLHFACASGNLDTVQVLATSVKTWRIEAWKKLKKLEDASYRTAMDWARDTKLVEVVKLLQEDNES